MAEDAGKQLTKNPLGPTGRTVAANVERLRLAQNLTFAALSEKLSGIGRPIPPLGLRKIVAETRRVDADDLAALAVALEVSPVTLLMPEQHEDGSSVDTMEPVEITGYHKPLPAMRVWHWLVASHPLPEKSLFKFQATAVPEWEQRRYEESMREARAQIRDELYRNVPGGVPDHLNLRKQFADDDRLMKGLFDGDD